VDLKKYLERKELLKSQMPIFRVKCRKCLQPERWCYCSQIVPFNCNITFVILIHPLELRRRIASGRMSHLMLEDSHLILGHDYSDDIKINQLIADPRFYSLVLCMGGNATNLSLLTEEQKKDLRPVGKQLLIFVIDGTWNTAFKTVRLSKNLRSLPRISFTPKKPSVFRVRRQPHAHCYSTIEAIHETIDLLGSSQGFDGRQHDQLLYVFDSFVRQQIKHIQDVKELTGTLNYRRYKAAT